MVMAERRRRCAAILAFVAGSIALGGQTATAEISFKDKIVSVIIADSAGGGTDATARVAATFLSKYLPGQPAVVPRNMGGANGLTAISSFVRQSKPDGLTVLSAPNTPVDPLNYRLPNVTYDLSKFHYIGGMWRGGSVMVINTEAEKRLHDKTQPPVVLGSITAVPRPDIQVAVWAIEYLGWNGKWVTGYPGTNDVMLALERGEVDMTTTGNLFLLHDLIASGKFKILSQSGAMKTSEVATRSDYGDAPLFTDLMAGKIKEPVAKEAFAYWEASNKLDKWLALPPDTPQEIVDVYLETWRKISADPEFIKAGERISPVFGAVSATDVEALVTTLIGTSNEAANYTKVLMRKQGLNIE